MTRDKCQALLLNTHTSEICPRVACTAALAGKKGVGIGNKALGLR